MLPVEPVLKFQTLMWYGLDKPFAMLCRLVGDRSLWFLTIISLPGYLLVWKPEVIRDALPDGLEKFNGPH